MRIVSKVNEIRAPGLMKIASIELFGCFTTEKRGRFENNGISNVKEQRAERDTDVSLCQDDSRILLLLNLSDPDGNE